MITVDASELIRLRNELRAFDPKLLTQLRKRIKVLGLRAVDAIKEELDKPSPGGGPDEGSGRDALASGTSTVLSFGVRSAGVKIRTTSARLPDEHKSLLNVYNSKSSRHPVFGRNVWVEQPGRPYFGAVIGKQMDDHLADEMRAAIDEACWAIGARGR